jgi:hypothetical protein
VSNFSIRVALTRGAAEAKPATDAGGIPQAKKP